MRILKLTSAVEKNLLRARHERDLEAERVAAAIIADVRKRGDAALFAYTKKFDAIDLRRTSLWISNAKSSEPANRSSRIPLRHPSCRANVPRVAEKQLPRSGSSALTRLHRLPTRPPYRLHRLLCSRRPFRSRLHAPHDRHPRASRWRSAHHRRRPSPTPNSGGSQPPGRRKIARIGGAQAIAALAYGTNSIPRGDKLFGPGNRFVTAAKQLVSSDCAIDLPAGPTEAIVLATSGKPRFIAADLLAQAEHAPDAASFLVTPSQKLARAVQAEVEKQLAKLPSENPAHYSTRHTGAILPAPSRRRLRVHQPFRAGTSQPPLFARPRPEKYSRHRHRFSWFPRAAARRLYLRQQSRPAHRRLGTHARRPFHRRLCQMHKRANLHARWLRASRT